MKKYPIVKPQSETCGNLKICQIRLMFLQDAMSEIRQLKNNHGNSTKIVLCGTSFKSIVKDNNAPSM